MRMYNFLHMRSSSLVFLTAVLLSAGVTSVHGQSFPGATTLEDCDTKKYVVNCYMEIYQKIIPTVAACKKIATVDPYQFEMLDNCAFRVGMTKGQKECAKFQKGGRAQQQCTHGVAVATKNGALCQKLPNTTESSKLSSSNETIYSPDWIYPDMRMRDDCYEGVSIKSASTKYCSKIVGDPLAKKFCFIIVASKKKDADVCIQLPYENRKECVCHVNNATNSTTIDCSQPRN